MAWLNEIENMYCVYTFSFRVSLLAFYHEFHSLIGYPAHYLFTLTSVSVTQEKLKERVFWTISIGKLYDKNRKQLVYIGH